MERKKKEGGQVMPVQDYNVKRAVSKWRKQWTVLPDWKISMFPEEKAVETLGEWPLVKETGRWVWIETDSPPDPACARLRPRASTSLICICRYTCTLHCIVMLVLLCKDFYCYLLEISLPPPFCFLLLFFHGQAAWSWNNFFNFHNRDFCFIFFLPPSLLNFEFSSKGNGFYSFSAPYIEL